MRSGSSAVEDGEPSTCAQYTFAIVCFRLRDARLQDAVVGEQQQTLAVGIEAAGGIDAPYVDVIARVLRPGSGLNYRRHQTAC